MDTQFQERSALRRSVLFTFAAFAAIYGTAAGCARAPVGLHESKWIRNVEYAERGVSSAGASESRQGADHSSGGGTRLLMDIAMPQGLTAPAPAVVWLHGGAWAYGSRNMMRPLAEFTASLGYVSATVQYRLVNKSIQFPEPVRDAAAAVAYLRANAERLNIDPKRIVIGGESAGGHIAMMVGLCRDSDIIGRDPSECRVNGIINIYGPTELVSLHDGGGFHVGPVVRNLVGCKPDEGADRFAAASPVTHVRSDSPPILILHGELDSIVPYDQAERMVAACRERGARFELGRVRRAEHAWVAFPNGSVSRSTLPLIAHFLGRTFCAEAAPHPGNR